MINSSRYVHRVWGIYIYRKLVAVDRAEILEITCSSDGSVNSSNRKRG